jgi:hypothetical protein
MRREHTHAMRAFRTLGDMPHLLRFLPSLALAATLLCACESQHQDNWDRLKVGMTKTQVADLLGEPSSRYEPRADNGKVVIAEERWQYGDNLSTLATGAVFPSEAHPRAWVVYFDEKGNVRSFRAADWAR